MDKPTDPVRPSSLISQELEAMKEKLRMMEEEAAKLRQMQDQTGDGRRPPPSTSGTTGHPSAAEVAEVDSRSIYVGNVDYGCTPEELQAHFGPCGTINRITIQTDKFTGQPKGFAYIEFAESAHVVNAQALDESVLRNRLLKVTPKRTNIPGFNARGRGGMRGMRGGMMMAPMMGFRGRSPRGRGGRRGHFAPY